ncbi:hypothetical protein [Kitasatospora purpeofusca]|uniref:hypothetical protein n=1 Tax=Kitasatospora purpeofusca TaxID=67352 RepID=UPI003F4AE29B
MGQISATGSQWYFHDHLGSTRALTDTAGAIVGSFAYTPSGRFVFARPAIPFVAVVAVAIVAAVAVAVVAVVVVAAAVTASVTTTLRNVNEWEATAPAPVPTRLPPARTPRTCHWTTRSWTPGTGRGRRRQPGRLQDHQEPREAAAGDPERPRGMEHALGRKLTGKGRRKVHNEVSGEGFDYSEMTVRLKKAFGCP